MNETLEQQGARNLQALLVNPRDGLALHNMIKCFTASVSKQPSKCLTICPALDAAGRPLCAAAMKAQALISASDDADKLLYGVDSLRRIQDLWSGGYQGTEDVLYWRHFILRPVKQLELVLNAYTHLLRDDPEKVKEYSHTLLVDMRDVWRSEHLSQLDQISTILEMGGATTQGKANVLMSEVAALKRDLV